MALSERFAALKNNNACAAACTLNVLALSSHVSRSRSLLYRRSAPLLLRLLRLLLLLLLLLQRP